MKVLIVANHNTGKFVPFILEQVDALRQLGVEIDFYGVHGKGIRGYLSNLGALKAKIRQFRPDLVHAHYGLSGLLANLQRQVPVVTTYHGSDIHSKGRNLLFSRLSMWLSAYNIFVTEKLQRLARCRGDNHCVLPCGIDTTTFCSLDRMEARKQMGWQADEKYVLFAGAFDNKVKNSALAKRVIDQMPNVHLIELRGYNREQVNYAMNAADCLLMTSHREGSPQVIKEALVCGTPIVSVKVGDVPEVTKDIDGCFVTSYDEKDLIANIQKAFAFKGKTLGHERIARLSLSNNDIAKKIYNIYLSILLP